MQKIKAQILFYVALSSLIKFEIFTFVCFPWKLDETLVHIKLSDEMNKLCKKREKFLLTSLINLNINNNRQASMEIQ